MRFFERLAAAGQAAEATGQDEPASAFLEPGNRWNGLLGAISTYYSGTELDNVSIIDFERYADSEVDWRVVGGYGAFIALMGAELPVRLSCAVTRVDTTGRRLRVETTRGAIDAQALIVTVPTNVLADGAIRFEPSLDDHLAAAAGLPLGLADKLYFALPDAAAFAPETRLIGATDRVATGSYTIRPRGRPLVEGYFGGDYARALERGGLAAFVDAARREIGAAYGHSFADKLEPLIATGWAQDPYARGSYSYARPGSADARAKLAEPAADGRVLFAGEATSPHFFSTAHGAWEEGVRAARSLIGADRAASAAVHP
jgi:monoamine oxidase